MQAKLLSAIQNKTIVKVGSNKPISVDIRLVCATNCNLEQMVADGIFREDLLYRINTIHIEVPALRDRDNDILLLADFFLKKFSAKYGKPGLRLNHAAEEKLSGYHWPGNIRELQHTVERAIILSDGQVLKANDFPFHNKFHPSSSDSPLTLDEMEQQMIQKALERHEGNQSAAAEQLGITRQTLYNKLKKQGN